MKKICMVAYTNYLSDARPRREAETLARRGDQVDFISLAENDQPSKDVIEGVRLFRLRQMRYRGNSGLTYALSYVRFLCTATLKLTGLFQRERYDIVYFHTMPDLIVLVGLIPKLFGARIVLNIHDMMPELYMSKFGISARHPLIRFLQFQEQFSIWLADKVICVHDPHRDVLCKRGAPRAKITVLPNVPDPLVFRINGLPPKTGDSFRIVYHGTIAKRLGLDLAVRAFAKAAASCPNARLEIFGNGDAGNELEAQIKASGVEDKISFRKRMFSVGSIAQMVQGASVGLIPNRRDVSTDYMLPVKLLEYVHLGIPVIAPRLLAIQYYFGEDQVLYYEPGDVDELADSICRLYADPEKGEGLALKGAEFAKKFNWDTLKEELYKVVDDGFTPASQTESQDAEQETIATLR
jgi:glycosyltransferase involved in cell wall biosynthesis